MRNAPLKKPDGKNPITNGWNTRSIPNSRYVLVYDKHGKVIGKYDGNKYTLQNGKIVTKNSNSENGNGSNSLTSTRDSSSVRSGRTSSSGSSSSYSGGSSSSGYVDNTETTPVIPYTDLCTAIKAAIYDLQTAKTGINTVRNGIKSNYQSTAKNSKLPNMLLLLDNSEKNDEKIIKELEDLLAKCYALAGITDVTGVAIPVSTGSTTGTSSSSTKTNTSSSTSNLKTNSQGMIDLTGSNKSNLKNLKITGKVCVTDVPTITAGSGVQKASFFKQIYLPDKYVATPTHIEQMHYVVKMNNATTVTTTDGTKVKLAKGEKVVMVRHNNWKNKNSYVTCVIQNGANKGKTFKIKSNQMTIQQQLTDSSIQYTKETAEHYVNNFNGKPIQSKTNSLLWVNTYTQRMYYFTRKNANSPWVLTKYPVNGYQGTYSTKIATGSIANGGNGFDTTKYPVKQLGSHLRNLQRV